MGWDSGSGDSEKLERITRAVEQIAKNTSGDNPEKLKLDAECSTLAQLLGTIQGFYVWLSECLDDEDAMRKARKLRELHTRAGEMFKSYQQQLDEKQGERMQKFGADE